MTQEDKELFLKDLCARLPYGVKCVVTFDKYNVFTETLEGVNTAHCRVSTSDSVCEIELIKPYLRPMSSMTDEEYIEYQKRIKVIQDGERTLHWCDTVDSLEYLNSIHVDYRGLIDKCLAIAVTENNNPYE